MTGDETDLLIAEYVLGTLDPADCRALEQRLDRDPDLRARLAKWEGRLAAAADETEEVPVSSGLWSRIEASIEAAPAEPTSPPAEFLTIKADQGGWESLTEGVEKKTLLRDRSQGVETFLIRIAPGTSLEQHGHDMVEECLVLEGDIVLAGQHLKAGDFQVAFPGLLHQDVYSESGCLLYVRGEIR